MAAKELLKAMMQGVRASPIVQKTPAQWGKEFGVEPNVVRCIANNAKLRAVVLFQAEAAPDEGVLFIAKTVTTNGVSTTEWEKSALHIGTRILRAAGLLDERALTYRIDRVKRQLIIESAGNLE